MTRWLAICVCTIGVATMARAAPLTNRPLTGQPPPRVNSRTPELRIVRPPTGFDPSPMIQSGMVADTGIAPNTRIGFGLFSIAKRNSPTELRADQRAPKSRKVGVSLRFRF